MKRRVFALLMALVMVLGMLPAGALATEEQQETQEQQQAADEGAAQDGETTPAEPGESGGEEGESTPQPEEPVQAADLETLLAELLDETMETVLVTGEITITAGETPRVLTTGDTVLIADGAHLTVAPGVALKCPNGLRPQSSGDNLYNKLSAAAVVTLAADGGSPIVYGSMADLRADVANLPGSVNSVEFSLKEPGAAYVTLDFNLPYAEYIYSDDNLEIARDVALHAGWLRVNGDCIWYSEDSVWNVADGEITGRYPRLMARPLYQDGAGFHEDLNMEMGGGYDFDRALRDEFSAFYVQYFDGYQWVIAPVDVSELTVNGPFMLLKLADMGQNAAANCGVYWAGSWNVEGSIEAANVDGNGLNLGYRLGCWTGPVNFFTEPEYNEDYAVIGGGGDVSTLTGRTIYAASYLAEGNLSDLYWYAVGADGSEMPLHHVAHFGRMDDYCGEGQTVWSIHVPAEIICDNPYGLRLGVRGRAAEDGNAWDFGSELDIYPVEALAWTEADVGDDLTLDMFGILQDRVSVAAGGSVTGWVYKTYFNDAEGCWKAGIYAADEGVFHAEGDVALARAGADDARTVVSGTATGGWNNRIVWTKETSQGVEADWRVVPLEVEIIGGGSNAAFYEYPDFDSFQPDELPLSPLRDVEFCFGVRPAEGITVTGVQGPDNVGLEVIRPDDGPEGMYKLIINESAIRQDYIGGQDVQFVLTVTDGQTTWQEVYTLPAYTCDTLAWLDCEEIPGSINMDDLTDVLSMAPGQMRTGAPVRVYYSGETKEWATEVCSSNDVYPESRTFTLEESETPGLSTITCTGAGQMILWLKLKNDAGQTVNAPDMGAGIPLRLKSTQSYLTVTWLHDDGDGRFYESEDVSDSFRITPLEEYALLFRLNWLDAADNTWKSAPVVPQSVMDESGMTLVSVRPLEAEHIADDEANGDYFVWVRPHSNLWGQTVSITAVSGDITGAIPVEVDLHTGGFYTHNGRDYEPAVDGQGERLGLKVVGDTEVYFKPTEGAMVQSFGVTMNGNALNTWQRQDDGLYRITVPAETARALGNELAEITASVTYVGNRTQTCSVPAQTRHAIVWSEDNRGTITIQDDDPHYLSHELFVPEGTMLAGQIYYVWYNEEQQCWQADPYGGSYLVLEGGGFDFMPIGDDYGPVLVECGDRNEIAYMRWTNHAFDESGNVIGPNEGNVDEGCLPLVIRGEDGLPGGFYESSDGNKEDRALALEVSPISGGRVYLIVDETKLDADYTPTVEGANGDVGIVNLGGGVFEIEISPAVARSCVPVGEIGFTFNNLSGEGQTTFTLPLAAMDAIAWRDMPQEGSPVQYRIELSNEGNQGLTDWLELKPGETEIGHVYFVYYNSEEGKWLADLYGGDYLRLEGDVFEMNSVPDNEDDDHNWDDATAITAHGGGMGQLWWTNHAMDEEGTVTGPNDEADYNTFSLKICATGTYLTQNWVDQYDDGNWDEAWNEDTGCLNTPMDQPHRHTFYLNYWVDGEGWHRESVVPKLSVTIKDESGEDVAVDNPGDYVIVHDVDGRRVDVKVLRWDCKPTLTASCTVNGVTYTASMDIAVELPREGFYSENEASRANYITEFQPAWGDENTFYFIMNSENPGDAIRSIKTGNPHVTIAQPDANNPYLYKITVIEPTSTGEELWLDMTLASGEEVSRGIRLHGAPGFLAHRNLRNDGWGWYVGDADYHQDLNVIGPGRDRWLIFSYVPAEGEAQDVEVTVTKGAAYVTLTKVQDMEYEDIVGEAGGYYYYLQTKPGAWDQQVTLSATVGDVTVSDTFTIREEDLSWYSQPNADREYYISDFTLTEDSNTLYLRANMPEGWWVEDNISTGWEDEDGNWYPHGGCETIRDIRWLDNGFFRITLDPETAQINYGRRSFGLDPQLHCKSQWGHDEMWGTGIHVENCLPYLTARSIDRNENGELVPSDSHAEDGMRTNPTQERFRVYYLNVLENDRWTEYPVQPELHFFEEDLGGCVWLRKSEEPDSGDIVSEYGHFLGVNSDAWGHSFAIRGSYGDHTGFMWVDVARDHVNFYSSPNPTADTYIDSFALNDLSGGNVFYVGAEDDWKIESVSTTWADGDESGCYENADLVTVTRVTDRAWKITVDAEGVRQRFGHDGFELELRVESKRGEDYDGRNLRIYIQNNLPFLRYAWLENDGGGWYLPVYDNGLRFEDGFGMFPEDSFYHIYALTYYDRMGIETTVPVIPTVSQGSVTVETVLGRGESVEDRQEYADSFVVLTSAANSWDTPVTLKAFAAGHTACMDVYIGRGEAEIYSSATDISNATVLKEFYKDPMNTARNVFWLAIEKETDWAKLAENSVQLQQTNLAALGEMTEVGDYYVWPVTLTEAGTKAPETFRLFVDYTWLENNEEQRQHFRTRDIWVSPGEIEGRVARFWVNFNEYFFVDAGQSDGSTLAYTWTENGVGQAEIPGLSYNSMTNTITLTDARLQQLDISAEDLPNADVTLALVGGSTITGGARGPALFLHGGVNLTITAEDKASLDISSTNTVNDGTDATDPWAHPALHLWENGDGNLTVTGNASVTLTVNGEEYEWSENDQYEETEEGQRIPAHMNAIGGNVGSKGTLTVSGNAVLVITPPEHPLDRWSGIEGFKTIELRDSAVLNTSRLDLHGEQESFLRVLDNSTLSVGMTGDDNGSDYYFGGIYIENGYLTIAGGTVNVTAPAFTTDKHLYTTGISLHSGSFGFVAGSLNIDLSGFGVTPNGSSEWINGCGLQLGDSEDFTHSVKWGVDGGETIINLGDNCATGVQLCANASADLQKGSLTVNGFQGFVNQGLVQLRDGMAITLRPWENQDGSTQHTAGNGMFVNDIHYAARRIASLNMMGGTLTAVGGSEPAMVTQGELTQSGGRIILSTDGGRPAAQFFGKNIITGGSMELTAPIGMHIAPDSHLPQNYLRLAGGELTVNCGFNGVVAMAPMVLQGGSLTINQTDADAQEPSSALLLIDDGSLTVTGGEHVINAAGNPLDMGLRVFGGTKAEFRGGKMTVTGGGGALLGDVLPDETTPTPANPITFTGVFMHEPDSDVEMEFLTDTFRENVNGEDLAILRYTPGARSGDEVTPAAAVVIEPGQGIVNPTVEPTARVEVTTAKPTAGAYITVQATVTADDGVVSFVTNDVSFVPDSITVNGVAYSGDLSNIPVEGSAAIVFRVKSEGYTTVARVDCILTDGDAEINATTGSFTVYDFQMTAPTYTTYDTITVRGAAAPGSDLELKIGEIRTVAIEVTELGTFAKEIELPIREGQYNAQSFTLTPVWDGVMQAPLTVVYNPTSVRLDFLRITNQVVDGMGTPTSATNEVSFLTGTGMPERSFYTYIPDMNRFDFETEFYVPLGWLITKARVEVTYMDGTVEKLPMTEAVEQQIIHSNRDRTEFWVISEELAGAPVNFKVVYQVARIKGTVTPMPDPQPNDPGYVEEEEERETEELPLLPIIDPSGTIYSGTIDNPIAGAMVTLYFGGTGENPVELTKDSKPFDMTPLGQVNPQVTDGSGHYSWDVPTGWWKVVAEKDGFRAESQWVHVLPAHTDLHLNLNMPSAKSGAYDLIRVRPVTINGKIPTGKSEQFSAEVTVTNFTADESAVLMVAAYGEGGKYLGMQMVPVSGLDKGVTTTATVTLSNAGGEAASLKAFLVRNMTNLTPVSGKVEFSNSDN